MTAASTSCSSRRRRRSFIPNLLNHSLIFQLHAAGGEMLDFCIVIIISLLIYSFCYSKGYLSISPQDPVAKLTLSHHLHVEFKTCRFSNNDNLVRSARQQIGCEFRSALNTNTSGLLWQSLL
jgi:hypothetical protein